MNENEGRLAGGQGTPEDTEQFIRKLIGDDGFRNELEAAVRGGTAQAFLEAELQIQISADLLPAQDPDFTLPSPHHIADVYSSMKTHGLIKDTNHVYAAFVLVHPAFPLVSAGEEADAAL